MSKEEARDNMNLFLSVLQVTMKTTGIALGWDLKNKKLVLQDVKTGLISRINLEELNKNLIS
ncbi:hypothetical protein Z959_08500 [Clostridium novyi B str. ATCC 27606]|uniref:Uncharacterized protein n=1 Tax=Clostridium novyi B str. ATCC 27606 TaxID=1443123 RepID=A0AA40IV93_CLONO|nr:hypothetical protein [Clostridium novyi]KEI16861.1 hypothetical protein Z959_08500 [Clostridium novyi B str. ATCC 27606]